MPDRRRGVRILTLKNAAWFGLSVVVLFLIYSTYMEHRARTDSAYGRLYERRIAAPPPPR
jgi:hypothetical protein